MNKKEQICKKLWEQKAEANKKREKAKDALIEEFKCLPEGEYKFDLWLLDGMIARDTDGKITTDVFKINTDRNYNLETMKIDDMEYIYEHRDIIWNQIGERYLK